MEIGDFILRRSSFSKFVISDKRSLTFFILIVSLTFEYKTAISILSTKFPYVFKVTLYIPYTKIACPFLAVYK